MSLQENIQKLAKNLAQDIVQIVLTSNMADLAEPPRSAPKVRRRRKSVPAPAPEKKLGTLEWKDDRFYLKVGDRTWRSSRKRDLVRRARDMGVEVL